MPENVPYSTKIRCLIRLRTIAECGRKTPLKIGNLVDMKVGGEAGAALFGSRGSNDSFVSPGEKIEIDIRIAHRSTFKGSLYAGAKIELVEGHRTIGDGQILRVESS